MVKNLKAEFGKIVWPSKKTTIRESAAVIVSAVGLGVVIAVLDAIFKGIIGLVIV